MPGALLEVETMKKCAPLWREAHFQVKIIKHHMFGPWSWDPRQDQHPQKDRSEELMDLQQQCSKVL
jgi:hypothetical protein